MSENPHSAADYIHLIKERLHYIFEKLHSTTTSILKEIPNKTECEETSEALKEIEHEPSASTSAIPLASTSAITLASTSAIPLDSTSAIPVDSTSAIPLASTSAIPSASTSAIPLDSTSAIPPASTSAIPPAPDERSRNQDIPCNQDIPLTTAVCPNNLSNLPPGTRNSIPNWQTEASPSNSCESIISIEYDTHDGMLFKTPSSVNSPSDSESLETESPTLKVKRKQSPLYQKVGKKKRKVSSEKVSSKSRQIGRPEEKKGKPRKCCVLCRGHFDILYSIHQQTEEHKKIARTYTTTLSKYFKTSHPCSDSPKFKTLKESLTFYQNVIIKCLVCNERIQIFSDISEFEEHRRHSKHVKYVADFILRWRKMPEECIELQFTSVKDNMKMVYPHELYDDCCCRKATCKFCPKRPNIFKNLFKEGTKVNCKICQIPITWRDERSAADHVNSRCHQKNIMLRAERENPCSDENDVLNFEEYLCN